MKNQNRSKSPQAQTPRASPRNNQRIVGAIGTTASGASTPANAGSPHQQQNGTANFNHSASSYPQIRASYNASSSSDHILNITTGNLNTQGLDGTINSTTTSLARNPPTSQGIIVAVRVRPFNKRELKEPIAQHLTPQTVAQIIAASPAKQGVSLQSDNSTPDPIVDVESDGKTVSVLEPAKNYAVKVSFTYDYVFSPFVAIEFGATNNSLISARGGGFDESGNPVQDGGHAAAEKEQSDIFKLLGLPIVENALIGFNSCLMSYGQTAAGKTYTMMGSKSLPGIIPRVCRTLFKKLESERIQHKAQILQEEEGELLNQQQPAHPASRKEIRVTVTYMEIYNEKVRDLLRPREKITDGKSAKPRWNVGSVEEEFLSLKVRHHPISGPFVGGLTQTEVGSWVECVRLIRLGNELRMAATTDMNDSSSRSHAIFQLMVTQTEVFGAKVRGKDLVNHRTSKINLVDLAGSERQGKTNVAGKHLTEANYINVSLSTLRKVIDVLNAKKKGGVNADKIVVPYRESMITWILSDNFGGNSKTTMIANVSPHWSCLQETESTLRYATLAKGIVNRIKVNEDPSAKLIRDLQNQLKMLQDELKRNLMSSSQGGRGSQLNSSGSTVLLTREIEEQMEEHKKAVEELEAKESGMMDVIREARQREEQLRMEKEGLERDQQRWKREAERLAREKMELIAMLEKFNVNIGRDDEAAFWNDGQSITSSIQQQQKGDRPTSQQQQQQQQLDNLKQKKQKKQHSKDSPQVTDLSIVSNQQQQSIIDTNDESKTSIFDIASPASQSVEQAVNESFSCPPNQPRKYVRRRASVMNPEDLVKKSSNDDLAGTDQVDAKSASSSSSSRGDATRERKSATTKVPSRGSNNAIASRDALSDKPASAMLLGSLINTSSETMKPVNGSGEKKEKKDKKEKKEKKEKRGRRGSSAGSGMDELTDPFAGFGPKTHESRPPASGGGTADTNSRRGTLQPSFVSHTEQQITETSIPPINQLKSTTGLPPRSPQLESAKGNNNNSNTANNNTSQQSISHDSSFSNQSNNHVTPQHGRRNAGGVVSAGGGATTGTSRGGASIQSATLNNELPPTGRRSANHPPGTPLSLMSPSTNLQLNRPPSTSSQTATPSQQQHQLPDGSFSLSLVTGTTRFPIADTDDALNDFMKGKGDRVTSGRRKA